MTLEEIARECDLDISEIQEVNNLIDEFSIMSEFYHPSNFTSDVIHYSKIASVARDEDGFVIIYLSPSFARGCYLVNYEKFEELNRSGTFSEAEAREARQLFKKLELINSCKDTINRILQNIVKKQALYLETSNPRSLLPFSQKEMAKTIGLAPSSVSRAIRGKSIDTPWGEETPLGHFFPRPKRFKKELLKQLLETDSVPSSDEAIRAVLWEKYGVATSRRSVANLRKELKFPAARTRRRVSMGGKKTR
jgi:RNA polymerase sigma-54 factor